jgi:bile acid:Na+ symporter, BASS family
MQQIKNLLRNRNFILILSIILGITYPNQANITSRLLVPTLILIMTISMTSITPRIFRDPRRWLKPIGVSIILNYLILGGTIILLSTILDIPEPSKIGFIVLAAAPPAVAVVPFTDFLGGDPDYSIVGFTACYLAAFLVTPLTLRLLLGSQPGFQIRIFTLLVELIILPFILSRALLKLGHMENITPYKGTIVNWGFFGIIYTIVGLNNRVFRQDLVSLLPLAFIAFGITFILGEILQRTGKHRSINESRLMSMTLLGTNKNSGFAAGIALTIFNAETTVPATITTIFMLLYAIYLDINRT